MSSNLVLKHLNPNLIVALPRVARLSAAQSTGTWSHSLGEPFRVFGVPLPGRGSNPVERGKFVGKCAGGSLVHMSRIQLCWLVLSREWFEGFWE